MAAARLSAAVYTTSSGTMAVFKGVGSNCPSGQSGGLTAIAITAGAPQATSEQANANAYRHPKRKVTRPDNLMSVYLVRLVGTVQIEPGLFSIRIVEPLPLGIIIVLSVGSKQEPHLVVGKKVIVKLNASAYIVQSRCNAGVVAEKGCSPTRVIVLPEYAQYFKARVGPRHCNSCERMNVAN